MTTEITEQRLQADDAVLDTALEPAVQPPVQPAA